MCAVRWYPMWALCWAEATRQVNSVEWSVELQCYACRYHESRRLECCPLQIALTVSLRCARGPWAGLICMEPTGKSHHSWAPSGNTGLALLRPVSFLPESSAKSVHFLIWDHGEYPHFIAQSDNLVLCVSVSVFASISVAHAWYKPIHCIFKGLLGQIIVWPKLCILQLPPRSHWDHYLVHSDHDKI